MRGGWPMTAEELEATQRELGRLEPPTWRPDPGRRLLVAGVFVAGPTGLVGAGATRDPLWSASVALLVGEPRPVDTSVVRGRAGGSYVAGLLALREGEVLDRAIRSLRVTPDVIVVNGTGRDHPRRAGIALHVGAVLGVPSIGVTVRPLVATASEPGAERGSHTPLVLDREAVGATLRTRRSALPVIVHAAWRTDPGIALDVVRRVTLRYRTPEPIRLARRLAREARSR